MRTDLLVAAGLLIILFIWVGWSVYKSQGGFFSRDPRRYFLWDQSAGSLWVGFSYAASMVSASVFIPFPALFYTHGIGGWLYICLPVIAGTSTLIWFGPKYRDLAIGYGKDVYSPYEVIGYSYNSKTLGGVLFLLTGIFVIPLISMQIVGFGRLMEGMFEFDYHLSVLTLISIFIVYTIFAGMEGDVKTDLFQAIFMLIGLLFLAGYSLYLIQDPIESFTSPMLTDHLKLPGPEGFFETPTLISIALIMFALPIVNGHYLMRFLIAKNNKAMVRSTKTAAGIILSFYVLTAFIGISGFINTPGLASGDQLTGRLLESVTQITIGIIPLGAIIAGTILFSSVSASLSSVDSQFLSLGASASRDIFKNFFGYQLSSSQEMIVARIIMIVIGFAAIIMALDPPPLVIELGILAASGVFILLPTILGGVFFPKKFTSKTPFISILLGALSFVLVYYFYGSDGLFGWNPGVIGAIFSTLGFVVSGYLISDKQSQ